MRDTAGLQEWEFCNAGKEKSKDKDRSSLDRNRRPDTERAGEAEGRRFKHLSKAEADDPRSDDAGIEAGCFVEHKMTAYILRTDRIRGGARVMGTTPFSGTSEPERRCGSRVVDQF